MRKFLGFVFLVVVAASPAGAQMMSSQSMMGMGPLRYYVGTWSCTAGSVGQPPVKAAATYTLDSGLLREWILVPAQGKMKSAFALASVTTYDAQKRRYVQTWLGNDAGWSVDYAKPWTGNTEIWVDYARANGKLQRNVTVRSDQNHFSFRGYPTVTSTKADFRGSCSRTS